MPGGERSYSQMRGWIRQLLRSLKARGLFYSGYIFTRLSLLSTCMPGAWGSEVAKMTSLPIWGTVSSQVQEMLG